MRRRHTLCASLGLAILLALATPTARADAGDDPSDVLGAWSFKTVPYRFGQCTMTGTMHLSPDPEDGVYGCELTAHEDCADVGRTLVRQACTARRFGNQVSVRSRIVEFLETEHAIEGVEVNYYPDNFALTVQSAERMYGALVSAISAPVEFRRIVDGIS